MTLEEAVEAVRRECGHWMSEEDIRECAVLLLETMEVERTD